MFNKYRDYTIPFCKQSLTFRCTKKDIERLTIILPQIEYNGKDYYQLLRDRGVLNLGEDLESDLLKLLEEKNKIGFK